jgi:hypothetical protein
MDPGVTEDIDAVAPERRPLFERLQRIGLSEHLDTEVALSSGLPAPRVGGRRRDGGFVARHPWLSSGTVAASPAR